MRRTTCMDVTYGQATTSSEALPRTASRCLSSPTRGCSSCQLFRNRRRRWAATLPCLIALVFTAACQGPRTPASPVERCASAVSVRDHTRGKNYNDRKWIGVVFVGPSSADPVSAVSTTNPGNDLDLTRNNDVPNGPYTLIAMGRLKMATNNCSVHVKTLTEGKRPPEYLGITDAQASSIASGKSELVIVMVGPTAG